MTLESMRAYPCWSAAVLLQNEGLTLLRVLNRHAKAADEAWASATFLAALESFAGAIRFVEGTWMEGARRQDFGGFVGGGRKGWIGYALDERSRFSLPPILPPPAVLALHRTFHETPGD
eukprot:CAMPEP_0174731074 /NCGR_PEP_ID=MMETSP1094-20130205/56849_1 /TAXON_ID=156173 /ORGANISM="Chrysochromulina brevifilum, Strain UTEX LB 985" /LENGTH=118 /DNA_ID=CAMNT_0015933421 /DNA_START=12 /DNA_END=365 /DNA_ORIENTATION=-